MLLKAYKLEEKPAEFERMVLTAKRMKALTQPISETEPLMATGRPDLMGVVEQMKRVTRGELAVEAFIADMRKAGTA